MHSRRSFLKLAAAAAAPGIPPALREAPLNVRVAVLKFGTVNWELDVIVHNALDRANDVAVKVVELAGKDGTTVALQAGAVDVIVTDWLWVSRRRAEGADFTFASHSGATGGVMVPGDSKARTVADLKGRRVGIAGGPTDKSWIMLRAYARKTLGMDLAKDVEPVFGAPPLLNALIQKGELQAVLNFWHYEARLKAAGYRELIQVRDMLPALGLSEPPPIIGWVFSEKWARQEPDAIGGFLKASRRAKQLLAASDAEWDRIRPLTEAENDATFAALRASYRAGITPVSNAGQIAAAEKLMPILFELAGADMVGPSANVTAGTFWTGASE